MGWERESPFFEGGHFGNVTFDLDRTSPAGSNPATMDCSCDAIIQRQFGVEQDSSKVRSDIAVDLLTIKFDSRHGGFAFAVTFAVEAELFFSVFFSEVISCCLCTDVCNDA
jgi:hypothetical protein